MLVYQRVCTCLREKKQIHHQYINQHHQLIGLRENWNRKAPYLVGQSMFSCRLPQYQTCVGSRFEILSWLVPVENHGKMW